MTRTTRRALLPSNCDLRHVLFASACFLAQACAQDAAQSDAGISAAGEGDPASGSAGTSAGGERAEPPSVNTSTGIAGVGAIAGRSGATTRGVATPPATAGAPSGGGGTTPATGNASGSTGAVVGPDAFDDAGTDVPRAMDAGPVERCAMDLSACVKAKPTKVDACLEEFSECEPFSEGTGSSVMCAAQMAACVLNEPVAAPRCVAEFLSCEL